MSSASCSSLQYLKATVDSFKKMAFGGILVVYPSIYHKSVMTIMKMVLLCAFKGTLTLTFERWLINRIAFKVQGPALLSCFVMLYHITMWDWMSKCTTQIKIYTVSKNSECR